jgi:ribosomal protein L13E
LTENDLVELGVTSSLHKKKLLKAITLFVATVDRPDAPGSSPCLIAVRGMNSHGIAAPPPPPPASVVAEEELALLRKKLAVQEEELEALRKKLVVQERQLGERRGSGLTLLEAKRLGYDLTEARTVGYTLKEAKEAGYTPVEVKNAGYTCNEVNRVGYTCVEAKEAGYTLKEIKQAGYYTGSMGKAGFSLKEQLREKCLEKWCEVCQAGYTLQEIKEAGFAGFAAGEINCRLAPSCQKKGYFNIHSAGYTCTAAKEAGYSCREARYFGYTMQDVKGAGYSCIDAIQTWYASESVKSSGYCVGREALVPIAQRDLGIRAAVQQMVDKAGYSDINSMKGWYKTLGASSLKDGWELALKQKVESFDADNDGVLNTLESAALAKAMGVTAGGIEAFTEACRSADFYSNSNRLPDGHLAVNGIVKSYQKAATPGSQMQVQTVVNGLKRLGLEQCVLDNVGRLAMAALTMLMAGHAVYKTEGVLRELRRNLQEHANISFRIMHIDCEASVQVSSHDSAGHCHRLETFSGEVLRL